MDDISTDRSMITKGRDGLIAFSLRGISFLFLLLIAWIRDRKDCTTTSSSLIVIFIRDSRLNRTDLYLFLLLARR